MELLPKSIKKGQSIIEILIVLGMLAIVLPALLTGLVTSRSGKAQQQQRVAAVNLIQEADTAVDSVRNRDWATFAVNGTYYPTISGSQWNLTMCSPSCPQDANGFITQIVISDTNRDTNGNIVTVGGTPDPSTKKVEVIVSWTLPYASNIISTKYFTRHSNIAYIETTQSHFNATGASRTSVKVQASAPNPTPTPDDGEIVLSQTGGFGDWCNPALTISALDLPKNGVANAVSAIVGQAATGTGDNASGVSYANVSISDPPYPTPPVASIPGTFDGYKTNGVFTEQNYAYLATDTNHQQGVIIDLTSIVGGKYDNNVPFGTLDLGSASISGKSIFVANNIAYVTGTDGNLYTFDLTTRSGSHSPIGTRSLSGVGNKIVVVGSNAYIAVNAISNQIQIVNVSNPRLMPTPTGISVNGQGATDIFVNVPQNRAYLVTAESSSQPEFFIIDLGNNSVLGSYDTNNLNLPAIERNMSPKGVIAVSGAKVVLVGTSGQEYQVLRVDGNYETNPQYCGGIDVDTGINGVSTAFSSVTNRAFSYIITGDATAEFKIIEGGPGGTGSGDYVPTGMFISQPFPYNGPLANNSTFNSFAASIYQPVVNQGTGFYGIQIQVAVADPVGSICPTATSSYTFLGTDSTGTGGTHYFTTTSTGATSLTGVIPIITPSLYNNPSKCFRYKVVLNTNDSTLTPVFKDMTVNYSP